MNSIDVGQISGRTGQISGQGADLPGQQTASLMGEGAVVIDGEISLEDAAEELSLYMAEKSENKHHAERKLAADKALHLLTLDEISQFLMDSRNPAAKEKLEALTRHLLSGQGSVRQQTAEAFSDVSWQYLALQHALLEGEQQGADPGILDNIRDALLDLELLHGDEIHASLNCLSSAAAYADSASGVAAFQHAYRDVVLGEGSLHKTLGLVYERFGVEDAARGIKHLISALGHDLAATRPSGDSSRLQALISDLYHLEVAATVLDGCDQLSATMRGRHSVSLQPSALMQDLVSVSGEKWVSASRFSALSSQHGVEHPSAQREFLASVRQMLADLPIQVYADQDTRHSILDAAQDALDTAIDNEELS